VAAEVQVLRKKLAKEEKERLKREEEARQASFEASIAELTNGTYEGRYRSIPIYTDIYRYVCLYVNARRRRGRLHFRRVC
jgi:hypothetical protein